MSKFVTRRTDEWTAHNLQYLQNGDKKSLEECTLLKIKSNEIFYMSAYHKQHKGKRQDRKNIYFLSDIPNPEEVSHIVKSLKNKKDIR